jgi:hypothetical protein
VDQQVALIMTDLQMLKDEYAILESERNLTFRARLAAEVRRAKDEVGRVGSVINGKGGVAEHMQMGG